MQTCVILFDDYFDMSIRRTNKTTTINHRALPQHNSIYSKVWYFISCFSVGYREISMKIFFNLTLVPPVKIPILMFLLPRLIARASQPDGNMTSFILHLSRLT